MAGISISEHRTWICARWVVRYVLVLLKEKLPVDSPIRKAIEVTLLHETYFLFLDDIAADQLELFKVEVIKLFGDLKLQGPSCFAEPEFYPGAMERIAELIELLGGRQD